MKGPIAFLVMVVGLCIAGLMEGRPQVHAQAYLVEQVKVFSATTNAPTSGEINYRIVDQAQNLANSWLASRGRDIIVTGRQANVAVAGGQFATGALFQTTYVITIFYHTR